MQTPVPDLKLAAVAQITIMDAQNLVDELEGLRMATARQLESLCMIVKAFGDLYTELTEKTADRKWFAKQILKAERESNRQQIPSWFWRLSKEISLDAQMMTRARWLIKEKPGIHLDDLWDTLVDALTFSNIPIDSTELQRIVEVAINGSAN